MKKYFSLFAIAVLLSCSKEAALEGPLMDLQLNVTNSDSAPVKSSYFGTGDLVWSHGDKINVFDGVGSREFTTYVTESPKTAAFFGQISKDWTKLTAVYPYNAANELLADGKVKIVFPACQTAVKGGFTDGSNPSAGVTTDAESLNLKNLGAYIKLDFKSSKTVRAIYIASNTDKVNITGKSVFDPETGKFVSAAEGHNSVTLIPEESYIEPGTYYAVVAPAKLSNGIRIFFRMADGKLRFKRGNNTVQLRRNATLDLGTIDVDALASVSEKTLNGVTFRVDLTDPESAFTEKLPGKLTCGRKTYITTNGGYEFTLKIDYLDEDANSRGQGWVAKSGYLELLTNSVWQKGINYDLDGLILPALEGMRLQRVDIGNSGNIFPLNICNYLCTKVYYDDDYETMPADKYNANGNWLGGSHVFTLAGTKVDERYRLVSRVRNAFHRFEYLELSYEVIVPEQISPIYEAEPEPDPDPDPDPWDGNLGDIGFEPIDNGGELQ